MKPFFLFLFFLSVTTLSAQSQLVSYAYDNAGNRISRKIVLLNNNPSRAKRDTASVPTPPVVDQLGERKITVYPNPTKGAIAVEITGKGDKDNLRITLISPLGVALQTIKAESGTTPVNLSTYAVGWYILRVQAEDKTTEFKIVKQ